MGETVTIRMRMTPTVKAVPLAALAVKAEVLLTSRKQGTVPYAPGPSWGRVHRECLRRGYDLILQASFAPFCSKGGVL
jgi:hypothetical protein